jgi:hypothetical protein
MTLFEVFDRLELTPVGAAIRDSTWLFPVIESGHLLGLAVLGGAVLVVDLRLLGVGLRTRLPAYVLEQARPWLLGAVTVMLASGIPLFLSEAVKCYFSPAFWVKMGALALALLFTFVVRNRLIRARPSLPPWQARGTAACSMALWLTVAAAGRWIGFS